MKNLEIKKLLQNHPILFLFVEVTDEKLIKHILLFNH